MKNIFFTLILMAALPTGSDAAEYKYDIFGEYSQVTETTCQWHGIIIDAWTIQFPCDFGWQSYENNLDALTEVFRRYANDEVMLIWHGYNYGIHSYSYQYDYEGFDYSYIDDAYVEDYTQ